MGRISVILAPLCVLSVLFVASAQATQHAQVDNNVIGSERNGFVTVGGRQYYIGENILLGWWDALNLCKSFNMKLASFQTEELYNNMMAYLFTNPNGPGMYWTSGARVQGGYLWSTWGQELTFVSWGPGEPSNATAEGCLAMTSQGAPGMHDQDCAIPSRYLCESACRL